MPSSILKFILDNYSSFRKPKKATQKSKRVFKGKRYLEPKK